MATATAAEHWTRTEPHFFNIFSIEPSIAAEPPLLSGLEVRLLSKDPGCASETYLAQLAAGWRQRVSTTDTTSEFFLLEGDVAANGTRVGAGGYVCLPQGSGDQELDSERGALSLVFLNPNLPSFPHPYHAVRVVKSWLVPAQNRIPGTFSQFYRSLRLPDFAQDGFNGGPGGYLRLTWMAPGLTSPQQHVHHTCWEEGFLLAGDLFIAEHGVMAPGSYVSFPQELWHAVLATQQGGVILVHTNGPMDFPWALRDYPVGEQVVEEYLDNAPWARPQVHQPWAETPYKRWQETPEYRAWRESPDFEAWGETVGQGQTSRFRASWKRTMT